MGLRERLVLSAVLATLMALTVAGCGGSGDSATGSSSETAEVPAQLSNEVQVANSTAICSSMNAALGPWLFGEIGNEDRVRMIAYLYRSMAVQILDVVELPEDDTTGYTEFMEAAKRLKKAEGDVVLAARRGDAKAMAVAQDNASSVRSSFRAASAVWGAEKCVEGPNPPRESPFWE